MKNDIFSGLTSTKNLTKINYQKSNELQNQISFLNSQNSSTQSALSSVTTEIADLHTQITSISDSSSPSEITSLRFTPVYHNIIGGNMYYHSYPKNILSKKIYFTCEDNCLARINVKLSPKASSSTVIQTNYSFVLNGVTYATFNALESTYSSESCGINHNFSAIVELQKGINEFYIFVDYMSYTYMCNSHYSVSIDSEQKTNFITNLIFLQFATNGTACILINCGGVSYGHNFATCDDFLTFCYSQNWKENDFQTAENINTLPVYMPEEDVNGVLQKSSLYIIQQRTNCVYIVNPDGTYKFYSCFNEDNTYTVSCVCEYASAGIGGICAVAMYYHQYFVMCGVYNKVAFNTKKYISNTTFPFLKTYSTIQTLTSVPMSTPQYIGFDDDGNGYFILLDISNPSLPTIEITTPIKFCSGVYMAHTYFDGEIYYMFYSHFGVTYRMKFTFSNNQINVIEDLFFSYAQEMLAVDDTHMLMISNASPSTISKCYYE